MKKIKKVVITGEKGGTGKSTVSALSLEYLNFIGKKVNLIDLDPLQVTSHYVLNCRKKGREVIESKEEIEYQIIDTAGIVGASLNYIYQADIIVVPFRAHFPDLLAIIPWFRTLDSSIRKKVIFLPNFWRNTKEQQQGLEKIVRIITNTKKEDPLPPAEVWFGNDNQGKLIKPLPDKPALLGTILNGSKANFFTSPSATELIPTMAQIFN